MIPSEILNRSWGRCCEILHGGNRRCGLRQHGIGEATRSRPSYPPTARAEDIGGVRGASCRRVQRALSIVHPFTDAERGFLDLLLDRGEVDASSRPSRCSSGRRSMCGGTGDYPELGRLSINRRGRGEATASSGVNRTGSSAESSCEGRRDQQQHAADGCGGTRRWATHRIDLRSGRTRLIQWGSFQLLQGLGGALGGWRITAPVCCRPSGEDLCGSYESARESVEEVVTDPGHERGHECHVLGGQSTGTGRHRETSAAEEARTALRRPSSGPARRAGP